MGAALEARHVLRHLRRAAQQPVHVHVEDTRNVHILFFVAAAAHTSLQARKNKNEGGNG